MTSFLSKPVNLHANRRARVKSSKVFRIPEYIRYFTTRGTAKVATRSRLVHEFRHGQTGNSGSQGYDPVTGKAQGQHGGHNGQGHPGPARDSQEQPGAISPSLVVGTLLPACPRSHLYPPRYVYTCTHPIPPHCSCQRT